MSADPTSRPARPALARRLAWVALLLILIAVGAWWVMRPVTVEVVRPQVQDLSRTLQFTGRVESRERVDLGVTVTGRVEAVRVREGDRVQAGQVLITLEQDESLAAQAQAEATLAQANATLQAARAELKRVRELVAQGFFSQANLDETLRAERVARAQRGAAQAALTVARARQSQTAVRAPANGQVLVRQVEPGQIVQAGKALLTVAVDGPTELVASVDERFLSQLQVGQRGKVVADAFPAQPFDAVVARLAPSVNAQTGAVEVTMSVPAPEPPFLREDMTLSIEVLTGQRPAARVLPLQAVRDRQVRDGRDEGTVMVLRDGRASPVLVVLGLSNLSQVEVTAGLTDDATVLLDPTVAEGTRVRARVAP